MRFCAIVRRYSQETMQEKARTILCFALRGSLSRLCDVIVVAGQLPSVARDEWPGQEVKMSEQSSPDVVVVSVDSAMSVQVERALRGIGCSIVTLTSFEAARAWIRTGCTSIFVSDVRLGDFNGLHLAWLRYALDPASPCIITHNSFDPVLHAEARSAGASYLVMPAEESRLTSTIDGLLRLREPLRCQRTSASVAIRSAKRTQGGLCANSTSR